MNYTKLVKSIESLPLLSDSTILVQQLYASGAENVDIISLVRIIESDALLTANLLKMINAPIYGFSRKISSVSQSVALFGTNRVYSLVLNYAIQESMQADIDAYGVSADLFNDICHMQSSLMMQWYAKIDLRHSQFLTPIALMMETGKLIISNEVNKSSYKRRFKNGLRECEDISHYEDNLLGTTSYHVTGILFDHWNFEELYPQMLIALDYDEDYDKLNSKMQRYVDTLDIIRTVINVKDIFTPESIQRATAKVELLNLDTDHFKNIVNRVKKVYDKKYKVETDD